MANKSNEVEAGSGAPQYGILDILGFAFAYGRTADQFNEMANKFFADKGKDGEAWYPDEYFIHAGEDGPHFVQFFIRKKTSSADIKGALTANTEKVRLIHEKDVEVFNDKVAKAFKEGYKMALAEANSSMKPIARLWANEFWFTAKMIKVHVSLIDIAQVSPKVIASIAGPRIQ